MQDLFRLLGQVASSDASVLIRGETGTGKELVARALHEQGPRRQRSFVAINCASLPETLLESELFGHVKGAFTGAVESRPGLLLKADGGTVFLDEIGDMPLMLQAKLLRAVQERRVRAVGGTDERPFDVRLIAATHRDLETAIEEGRFREDLFFRLNVISFHVPPLRARGSDVLLLAQHFLEGFAARAGKTVRGLSSAAAEKLVAYAWPGNVRELRNCIERAVALTEREELIVEDLPEAIRSYRASHVLVASDDPSELVPMEEVERRYVLRVLEAVRGNKSLAARILGFDRKTLYRKLERYGVEGTAEGGATS
jgi:two-component system response regulator HydG